MSMTTGDFSVIEARIAAQMAGETSEIGQARKLLDLHKVHAAVRNGVMYDAVTPGQRSKAKNELYMAMYTPGQMFTALPGEVAMERIFTADQRGQLIGSHGSWTEFYRQLHNSLGGK